jgi:hypothetical protein
MMESHFRLTGHLSYLNSYFVHFNCGCTSVRMSGHLRLLHLVRSNLCATHASSNLCARIRTSRFRSVDDATQMTRLCLFHTGVAPVSSRSPGRLTPASFTTASHTLCLVDTNVGGLHLQHETLECNIHLKQIKHLGHTLATCV